MKNNNFSSQVRVNHGNQTIEITKSLDNAARRYGSEGYIFLEDVRANHPNYRVVVKVTKRSGSRKGLTYKYMEEYIQKHDDEKGSIMQEFNVLRGKVAPKGNTEWDTSVVASYLEVKAWFERKFPEIEQYRENARRGIQAILNAA